MYCHIFISSFWNCIFEIVHNSSNISILFLFIVAFFYLTLSCVLSQFPILTSCKFLLIHILLLFLFWVCFSILNILLICNYFLLTYLLLFVSYVLQVCNQLFYFLLLLVSISLFSKNIFVIINQFTIQKSSSLSPLLFLIISTYCPTSVLYDVFFVYTAVKILQ